MTKLARSLVFALTALGAVAASRDARADDTPAVSAAEQAASLKRDGDAAMDAKQYAAALEAYGKAYALAADPALLYNQARAHQALGAFPAALDQLEQFRDAAPPDVRAKVPDLEGLIVEIRARVATLSLTCNVDTAHVRVRGADLGTVCDGRAVHVLAGQGSVEVQAEGHAPWTRQLDLRAGSSTKLEPKLQRLEAVGILLIRATPAQSLVQVDDEPLGFAPVEGSFAAGRHVVTVKHEGYVDQTIPLSLKATERRTLDVELVPPKPAITSRWWFWGAIAGAVVGGSALTYALTATPSAPSGSMSPGQLRGP